MEPTTIAIGGAILTAASAAIYASGSEDREKKKQYAEWEEKDRIMREERARKAYIAPRDVWNEEDLKPYDGTMDEDGPILMGVNGDVYNVWKGRHFYGPGCEYHIFAGRDATRLLAKSKLEEETEEEMKKKLNMADRATLQGWIYTFKNKYEIVGRLEGFDESTTSTRTM
jgi:membrane-associated progesterone receptor component